MILVDSSVWIRHIRHPNPTLSEYLETPEIFMHAMVLGELACGMFSNRRERFQLWRGLPTIAGHPNDDVIDWIESERLMGSGIGFIDAHLLYSTVQTPATRLWTHDKRLGKLARRFRVAYPGND